MLTNKYEQIKNIRKESPNCELEKVALSHPSQKYAADTIRISDSFSKQGILLRERKIILK